MKKLHVFKVVKAFILSKMKSISFAESNYPRKSEEQKGRVKKTKASAAVKRGRRRSKSARRMHMEFIRIGLRMWKIEMLIAWMWRMMRASTVCKKVIKYAYGNKFLWQIGMSSHIQ